MSNVLSEVVSEFRSKGFLTSDILSILQCGEATLHEIEKGGAKLPPLPYRHLLANAAHFIRRARLYTKE